MSLRTARADEAGRGALGAIAFTLLVLLTLLSVVPAGLAQTFPSLAGRVVDTADLIDPSTEAAITEKLAAFEQESSDQVAVATVSNLEGYEIADYANRLARQWALGRKGENNGVLLLVARDERKVRIEVGYGLEPTLTDALSRIIIENDILPAFRKGNFSAGIAAGVDGIVQVLSGDAAELEARAKRNAGWQNSGKDISNLVFFGIVFFFIFGPTLLAVLVRLFGGPQAAGAYQQRQRRGRRGVPVIFPGGWGGGGGGWGGGSGGGFSGGGGSFGGGGASGGW
ncbi:TPM domain-containing protein [Consotaella salsifontis]|nr:TPM domain-containing protein [Consotaella salsifontis]